MRPSITAIEYHLPETVLTTESLSTRFPEWGVEKIDAKTGIRSRHIAQENQSASDLAFSASTKLFGCGVCDPEEIDFILLCTQSPDYIAPTTACVLQQRLGIPRTAGALDFNLGCSGFVYGFGLAHGLIMSKQVRSVLLITAETYSKYIAPEDRSSLTIFGDAAAATLIRPEACNSNPPPNFFLYGTDGSGKDHLVIPKSGSLRDRDHKAPDNAGSGREVPASWLRMHGPEMFQFAMEQVPRTVESLLTRAELSINDIDLFVFHQANAYILNELRKALGIPVEKVQIALRHCGNTVSSSIPIALKEAATEGTLQPGALVMIVGFGVGFSWAGSIFLWTGLL